MSKFEVGDEVKMAGVPFVVKVLATGLACDLPDCDEGETFMFADPVSGQHDYMHESDFEKAGN